MSNNKTAIFKVNGMHCGGCANKIKNAINQVSEQNSTNVDVGSGEVSVKFDSGSVSTSSLKNAITSVGFEVESVELE